MMLAQSRRSDRPRWREGGGLGGDIILSVDGIAVVSEDNIEQIHTRLPGGSPGALFPGQRLFDALAATGGQSIGRSRGARPAA